ncbi:MAG: hypothetical protein VR69_02380 [Peptococcaceae bacterium BRH_c4b]|nr:MAG: hypothetical protein VR69_02380 [Peptococcaceae bacterium BRH_c4b]
MFSKDKTKAVELLSKYMNEHAEDKCLENDEKYLMTDQEVRLYFAGCGLVNINELKQLMIRTIASYSKYLHFFLFSPYYYILRFSKVTTANIFQKQKCAM